MPCVDVEPAAVRLLKPASTPIKEHLPSFPRRLKLPLVVIPTNAVFPDDIFVMDRDSAISTAGAKNAKEIVENELVKTTDAYKNNHIIYLEHSNVWYTAEGGIQALDIMLTDLEKGLK